MYVSIRQLLVRFSFICFIFLGGLVPAMALAAGTTSVSLPGSATNTSSNFNKYLFSFPVPAGATFTGLSGSASIYSSAPSFSEALVTVQNIPSGACPTNGEEYSSYPAVYAAYPSLHSLSAFIIKEPGSGTSTMPTQYTLPVGIPLTGCIVVVLDGSILLGTGSFTMTSNLVANFSTSTAPVPAPSIVALDDEFCFGQSWGCQIADATSSPQQSFIKVMPITKPMTLLSLYGDFSDSAFSNDGAFSAPPSGAWSMTNDYYIYPSCSLSSGVAGPADYYASIPANAVHLGSYTMQGNGDVSLQEPVFQTFSGITLNSGDCLVHLVKPNAAGGIDAEDQVYALVQATSSASRDTTPPSAPSSLTANATSSTEIDLYWPASTDNVGVSGYQVFRSGVQVATTTFTYYANTGLVQNTSYTYTVRAFDAAGNVSSPSSAVMVSTPAAPVHNVYLPTGYFDGFSATPTLNGWAYDPDTSAQSITVLFYVDGPSGIGQFVASTTAAASRPDVDAAFGITGNHGFVWPMPAQYTTATHTWYVYALDSSGNGAVVQIGGSPKTYTVVVPKPTVSLIAASSSILVGSSTVLTWSSTNAIACTGTNIASTLSGSVLVFPTQTTTYALNCSGAGGSSGATTTVTVIQPAPPVATTTLATGLIGYWPLDASTTNIAANTTSDVSGNGNTATLSGMSSSSIVTGALGQALEFVPWTGTAVNFGSQISFNGPFTFSARVRRDGGTGGGAMEIFNNNQFFLRTRPSSENATQPFEAFVSLADGSVEPRASSNIASTLGQWYLLTATWDGTTLNLYVNGVFAGKSTRIGTLTTSIPAKLGDGEMMTSDGNYWNGAIDDVRIYNRTLSPTEISQL